MADRWEISPEFPQGHFVPLTPEELADKAARKAAGEQDLARETAEGANDKTVRDRLTSALGNLETANDNWGTLTAAQKDAAMRADVRATAGLIRLLLHRLDTAGS